MLPERQKEIEQLRQEVHLLKAFRDKGKSEDKGGQKDTGNKSKKTETSTNTSASTSTSTATSTVFSTLAKINSAASELPKRPLVGEGQTPVATADKDNVNSDHENGGGSHVPSFQLTAAKVATNNQAEADNTAAPSRRYSSSNKGKGRAVDPAVMRDRSGKEGVPVAVGDATTATTAADADAFGAVGVDAGVKTPGGTCIMEFETGGGGVNAGVGVGGDVDVGVGVCRGNGIADEYNGHDDAHVRTHDAMLRSWHVVSERTLAEKVVVKELAVDEAAATTVFKKFRAVLPPLPEEGQCGSQMTTRRKAGLRAAALKSRKVSGWVGGWVDGWFGKSYCVYDTLHYTTVCYYVMMWYYFEYVILAHAMLVSIHL